MLCVQQLSLYSSGDRSDDLLPLCLHQTKGGYDKVNLCGGYDNMNLCGGSYSGKIVVEVDTACTEVASQEGGMRCKDGGHGQFLETTEEQSNPTQPLMEVSHYHWRGAWQS